MASSLFPMQQMIPPQVRQMMSMLSPNQSPAQMLESLVKQNPQYRNLMSLVGENNGDIKATVMNLAKQKGVDLNTLYDQFRSL